SASPTLHGCRRSSNSAPGPGEVCQSAFGRSDPLAGKPDDGTVGTGTGRPGPARLLPARPETARPSRCDGVSPMRPGLTERFSCQNHEVREGVGEGPSVLGASPPAALGANAGNQSVEPADSGEPRTGVAPPFRALLQKPAAAAVSPMHGWQAMQDPPTPAGNV